MSAFSGYQVPEALKTAFTPDEVNELRKYYQALMRRTCSRNLKLSKNLDLVEEDFGFGWDGGESGEEGRSGRFHKILPTQIEQ